jgi:hypothetical protein
VTVPEPNRLSHGKQAAFQLDQAWNRAHQGEASAEAFVELLKELAVRLNPVDPKVYLDLGTTRWMDRIKGVAHAEWTRVAAAIDL